MESQSLPPDNILFHTISISETEKRLQTSRHSGLAGADADQRLTQYGYNEFTRQARKSLVRKFLDQFKSFMILVLLVAAIVSGVVGYLNDEGFTDAIIIMVIVY